MKRYQAVHCLLLVVAFALAAPAADGQSIVKRIKEDAARKAEARKAAAEEKAAATAGRMVDSSLEKTGRGVDATVTKVGTVVDTAMNRTERGISGVFGDGDSDKIASDLSSGRAVVRSLEWVDEGAELTAESAKSVKRIARVMKSTEFIYLIESHTEPLGDPAAGHNLSEQRAAALKALLVAEGVPPGRIFALALGATRPATDGGAAERIEIARMQ